MRVMIDTNVLVDYLAEREPFFEDAKAIVKSCQEERLEGCVSSQSIADVFYILRKDFSVEERKRILIAICTLFTVVGIDKVKLLAALYNDDFNDFEDCLQMQCAVSSGADYIITRNEKDFAASAVKAIAPSLFCEKHLN